MNPEKRKYREEEWIPPDPENWKKLEFNDFVDELKSSSPEGAIGFIEEKIQEIREKMEGEDKTTKQGFKEMIKALNDKKRNIAEEMKKGKDLNNLTEEEKSTVKDMLKQEFGLGQEDENL